MSLQTAARDDIMMMIEEMIDYGNYHTPEPYMNLKLAITMMQSAYLKGRMNKVKDERLELLRRFMSEAETMLKTALQPEAPMPVQTGAQLPPPQAELLPNAPQPPAI